MIVWAFTVSFKFVPRGITSHGQGTRRMHKLHNLVRAVEAPIIGARLMFVFLLIRPSL